MSRLKAGRLRHRVDIERPSEILDDQGAPKMVWVEHYRDVPAAVEPLSAREFFAAQAVQSSVTARIVIRFKQNVDATMRVVHGSTIYNIAGVLPDKDSGVNYLTLLVSSGVNRG